MKLIIMLTLILSSNFAFSSIDRLTNAVTFNCGEKEAIKINMQSISSATLECRKFGQTTGEFCAEDSECSSSCCDPINGRCQVHDPSSGKVCGKPAGQSCKDSSYCTIYPITTCYLVKTGQDQFGTKTCAVRCITREVHGECSRNICIPPAQPTMPSYDVNDPNRCDYAVDYPVE